MEDKCKDTEGNTDEWYGSFISCEETETSSG